MLTATLASTLLVPLGLGLLGFIEPCTIGSSLLFIRYVAGRPAASVAAETTVFTLTRGIVIGALGAVAALAGPSVLPYQRVFWTVLGAVYIALGAFYLAGRQGVVMRRMGPALAPVLASARRSQRSIGTAAGLGILFGLNVPACATPLLAALFAASLGATTVALGFWSMAVFGLALSLPLVAAVYSRRARSILTRIAAYSDRVPRWTGAAFVVLGVWSIHFS